MENSQTSSLVGGVSAILLISPDAAALADFYRSVLGLPLEDEVHDGVPLHYACELQAVHFAIHPAEGWPGATGVEPRSPVLALATSDAAEAAARLQAAGVAISGPFDHGFAWVVSFRDPDGNHIELLQSSNTEREG